MNMRARAKREHDARHARLASLSAQEREAVQRFMCFRRMDDWRKCDENHIVTLQTMNREIALCVGILRLSPAAQRRERLYAMRQMAGAKIVQLKGVEA